MLVCLYVLSTIGRVIMLLMIDKCADKCRLLKLLMTLSLVSQQSKDI